MATTTQTVREIALENPATIRVFEKFGIDYCCGGRRPLDEACAQKNVAVEIVIAELERAQAAPAEAHEDWQAQPLSALITHIVTTHHVYVRRELQRLHELAGKVVNRHGDTRPELPAIQARLYDLSEELTQHCAKEEIVLFPYVNNLERAIAQQTVPPIGCFGTIASPIAVMMQEHDSAGGLLSEIRELSGDFQPPVGACPTYHAFYTGLKEFEQDLHQHIHLENNVLFPRAMAMEAGTR